MAAVSMLALAGCATPVVRQTNAPSPLAVVSAAGPAESAYVVRDGERLAGSARCANWILPEGVEAVVVGDFEVQATGRIELRGTLRVADNVGTPMDREAIVREWSRFLRAHPPADGRSPDRPPGDLSATPPLRGHALVLEADGLVWVAGELHGGHGVSPADWPTELAVGLPGGQGSPIVLVGERVQIDGRVVGGTGGVAGPGGDGGKGGDVVVFEANVEADARRAGAIRLAAHGEIRTGAGGQGATTPPGILIQGFPRTGSSGAPGSVERRDRSEWTGLHRWLWDRMETREN